MIHIRKASLEDLPVIHEMASVVFPHTYAKILSPEQLDYMMEWMYSIPNLQKQITEENHIYYLAYEDDQPVGYVSIQPEGKDVFHLQKIYVLPDQQGKHYGQALFMKAIEAIKEIHPEPCQMRLNVNRNNKALTFYEHMGMKMIDQGDFPIGHGYYMNDYIMGLDI